MYVPNILHIQSKTFNSHSQHARNNLYGFMCFSLKFLLIINDQMGEKWILMLF